MRPFPELITMSQHECERFVAGPDDVCISIRSVPDEEPARVSGNYRQVLRVAFADWNYDEPPRDPDGSPRSDFIEIDEPIADKIVAFAAAHVNAKRLVVHCHAGVSRSVSTAMALAKCFTGNDWRPRWLKGHEFKPGTCAPNQIVYDAIVAAYRRSNASP